MPTALTEEEAQHALRNVHLFQCETCQAIIHRLDADLMHARAEIDKLAPTVLALEEEKVRLDTRVRELREHLATWKRAYGDLEARYLANPTTPASAGHCGHNVEGLTRERDALRAVATAADEEREEAYALVMEWDDLAHAASHSMPWEQQRAMLVERVARAFAARRPVEADVEAALRAVPWCDPQCSLKDQEHKHMDPDYRGMARAVLALRGGGK